MTALEAPFYDVAMTGEGEPAMLPLELSPWRPLYEEAARWVPSSAPVVDLGCGTGRFLAQLARTSHRARLTGIDFSAAAVAEARCYLLAQFEDEMEFQHRCRLAVADLREWQADGAATFVCLEVLEHLDDDLGLVRRVPVGAQFVFSVPNFPSEGHVRSFPTLESAFARYGSLLRLRRWTLIDFGGGNVAHLFDSTRRGDAW